MHATTLKQVPAGDYNPREFVMTNIGCAQNVIDAALDSGVKQVVALSMGKATAPINLHGSTKLVSAKLFVSLNRITGPRDLRFSVVCHRNVMGSRGSVVPFVLVWAASGELLIIDQAINRFNILLDEGVDLVLWAIERARGG